MPWKLKNIWKLNNVSVFHLVIKAEGVVTKNFQKCVENISATKLILRFGQKAVLLQTLLYKANTRIQIKQKRSNTQKQNTKQTKQKQYVRRKQHKIIVVK